MLLFRTTSVEQVLTHPDERMGIAMQLFSTPFDGARTYVYSVCGLPIARALLPNALVVIFIPMAAKLCVL